MRYHCDDRETFKLESWGGGLSYTLTHKPSGKSVFVQGDSAETFGDDLEKAETAFPDKTFDEIYMWLWDQCEYGSAAS